MSIFAISISFFLKTFGHLALPSMLTWDCAVDENSSAEKQGKSN